MLPDHEDTRHDEVPEGGDDEQRNRRVDAVGDGVRGVLQVEGEGHGQHEGGRLEHADGLVAQRRDDHPHGLGDDDAAHDEGRLHAQGLGRLPLSGVDGFQARTDDLGQVCPLVEPQTDDGGCQGGDDFLSLDAGQLRTPERHADGQGWVQHREQSPEHQLGVDRDAAEYEDVGPGNAAQHGIA